MKLPDNIRIRKHSFNNRLYVIDEIVTKDGLYITWGGVFVSLKGALRHIRNELKLSRTNVKGTVQCMQK